MVRREGYRSRAQVVRLRPPFYRLRIVERRVIPTSVEGSYLSRRINQTLRDYQSTL